MENLEPKEPKSLLLLDIVLATTLNQSATSRSMKPESENSLVPKVEKENIQGG